MSVDRKQDIELTPLSHGSGLLRKKEGERLQEQTVKEGHREHLDYCTHEFTGLRLLSQGLKKTKLVNMPWRGEEFMNPTPT